MVHEQRYIEDCAAAAHDNILLAKRVIESNGRLLQAGLHLTFNAAVVLLLNNIMAIYAVEAVRTSFFRFDPILLRD